MTEQHAPDDDQMLAAEYALGLLGGDELARARRRHSEDREFAGMVTAWEMRLAALTEDLPAERPDPAVKAAMEKRLFPTAARTARWGTAMLWQAVSGLCVLALALVVILDFGERAEGPLYTAEIATETGDFRVVAIVDKVADEVTLTRSRGAAPKGRILQVWAHGPGEPAMSVGLWPEGDTVRLPLPPAIAEVEGVLTLGVSEEPPGGSPTGSPSGRVFGTADIPGVSGAP